MSNWIKRFFPDSFLLILIATLLFASFFPARGQMLDLLGGLSSSLIFTLFFMHGARLSPHAVLEGFKGWRLHCAILGFGFAVMPLFGLALTALFSGLVAPDLLSGILFLCVLPTTVQASIGFNSMARGNVPAAVIASAASNLLAIGLTPLLFVGLAGGSGLTPGSGGVLKIVILLLVPFALGQLARRWIGSWVARYRAVIAQLDRATIVIAVFVAFSEAANNGLWARVSGAQLGVLVALILILLALAFGGAWVFGGLLGQSRADRITLLFSGAHKSLATGAPMIGVLFTGAAGGSILLPLILYHQLQLMVSAIVVRHVLKGA